MMRSWYKKLTRSYYISEQDSIIYSTNTFTSGLQIECIGNFYPKANECAIKRVIGILHSIYVVDVEHDFL